MADCTMVERIRPYILQDSEGRRDICTIYKDKPLLDEMIAYLIEPLKGKVDYVVAPESLGFILGGMIASALGVGFVPIRNGSDNVLVSEDAVRAVYVDHRDRARSLQMRNDNAFQGARILLVDDWIETAATMQASITMMEDAQAQLVGIACIGVDENEATEKMIQDGLIRYAIKK